MNQRGFAESTQWAILTPVALLTVLGLVQLGVWLHGRTVASQAAATVADLRAASSPDAAASGLRVAHQGGLRDVSVQIATTDGLVLVTVHGRAPVFFDLGQGTISETAVLPQEQP